MKIRLTFTVVVLGIGITCGCRSAAIAHRSSSRSMNDLSRVTVAQADPNTESLSAGPAESADSESGEIRQVSAELTSQTSATLPDQVLQRQFSIRDAIETSLAQNPDLTALRQSEGVGSAALGVAQTYPLNPYVQVRATPYQRNTSGGSGTTYHYVLLMQQIQLGHQQKFRESAACAALNSIRWNVLQAELLNVAQTERLYFAAIYQQGLRDLANIAAENNRQLLEILERQKDAGQATGADVAIVRLDARSTRQQQRIVEANFQTALLDLKRQLCLPSDCQVVLDQDVMRWVWQPASAEQLGSMAISRPDVMVARADTDAARANAGLANAARTPDLQIGPYYQRDDFGTYFLGFQAQTDIPVINNGMPLVRQRNAELFQRATAAQQLAFRANLEAAAAADRYERARKLRMDPDESALQSAPIELQRLEEQFRASEVDILRVLQARASLIQNQRAELDALNELMQAAVAVTAASGAPLELLAAPAPSIAPASE